MKTKLLTTVVCGLVLLGLGCSSENETLNNNHFAGTKWKLEGIVNEQTGAMQALEPTGCQQCYTLEFDTDSTAIGEASPNVLWLNISNIPILGIATYINHFGDEAFFCEVIELITNYECNGYKLKFFFRKEEINYYLSFKKLPQ